MPVLSSEAFLGLASAIIGQPLTDFERHIQELGVDSLQALELLSSIERDGVRLDEDVFIEARTLGDLYRAYLAATADRVVVDG